MYKIEHNNADKVEAVTFSELDMDESEIEKLLRCNIKMLCGDEETMLIVGQQFMIDKKNICDLIAVDKNGSIVLIEIKRDPKDINARNEPFEFQAVRYAASFATIKDVNEFVEKVYVSYIEKYPDEFKSDERNRLELGTKKLKDFLKKNSSSNSFNKKQVIIITASDFDERTLSSVAWLNSNGVDISCIKLMPYKINDDIFINTQRILPLLEYDDFYTKISDKTPRIKKRKPSIEGTQPLRVKEMLQEGIIKPGDEIVAKDDNDQRGILLENGNVEVKGKVKSINNWLKEYYGWSSINSYHFAFHSEKNKTLDELRTDFLDNKYENL